MNRSRKKRFTKNCSCTECEIHEVILEIFKICISFSPKPLKKQPPKLFEEEIENSAVIEKDFSGEIFRISVENWKTPPENSFFFFFFFLFYNIDLNVNKVGNKIFILANFLVSNDFLADFFWFDSS